MEDLPLVYLTFGTVAATIPPFAAALVTAVGAVATLPVRVLLTLGEGADPAAFAELPANVHGERWIPQAGVLPHASAVVCHGGYGSVQGALAAGVPLVVSPQFADQPYNAERVAALGAGVALPLGPPEPQALEEAVGTVLAERTYRSAAAALAEEIRALPPAAEAVDRFVENARHD
jgi:MGT family glycosyltransferase